MRKSIYIQFLIVALSLVVLFYVVLFHESSYIETPTSIGDTVGSSDPLVEGNVEDSRPEGMEEQETEPPSGEPERSMPIEQPGQDREQPAEIRQPAQQRVRQPRQQPPGPVETETNYQSQAPAGQRNERQNEQETLYR